MWLARAQEHSEEEDRGAGCEPTGQRAARTPPPKEEKKKPIPKSLLSRMKLLE
jgi:hypothetical protein